MTLTELRYIVVLADELNIGRAATRCHVSQPALSIALRKLEDELGLVLFERTKNKMSVSDAGLAIVAQARLALNTLADIKALADAGRDQRSGPIRLGTLTTLGPYMLPQLLAYTGQQFPAMPVHVQEDNLQALRLRLRQGLVDAILVSLPFSEPETVVQPLFDEPLWALVPLGHPLARRAVLEVHDLAAQPLLLMAQGHCLREQVLALCPWVKGQQEVAVANSLEMLRYLVAAGQGVAVVPRSAVDPAVCRANQVVALPLQGAQRQLALAWRSGFPRHKAIDALRLAILACSSAYWGFATQAEADIQSPLQAFWSWSH